jgi:hypothetical protein
MNQDNAKFNLSGLPVPQIICPAAGARKSKNFCWPACPSGYRIFSHVTLSVGPSITETLYSAPQPHLCIPVSHSMNSVMPRIPSRAEHALRKDRFRLKRGYLSGALPKLDMVAVHELLCLQDGNIVIGAIERNRFMELTV